MGGSLLEWAALRESLGSNIPELELAIKSSRSLDDALTQLSQKNQGDRIVALMQSVAQLDGKHLDAQKYTIGISACGRAKLWQEAYSLYEDMPRAKVQLNIINLNALLSAYEKSNQWHLALHFFEAMAATGLRAPNRVSFNTMLTALSKAQRWRHAVQTFASLPIESIQPNVISFSAATTCCLQNSQWPKAVGFFDAMPSSHVVPNVISFNAAIGARGKSTEWPAAVRILEDMEEAAFQPTMVSYCSLLSAFERSEQWQLALVLFDSLPKSKLQPTVISFNAVLSACEKAGQWQVALVLHSQMQEQNVSPDIISYNALISSCKGKQWQRALKIFDAMSEADLQPDIVSFSAAISACEKAREWQKAIGFFHGILESELQPVPRKALNVIKSWPDGTLGDVAQQTYKALQLSDMLVSVSGLFLKAFGVPKKLLIARYLTNGQLEAMVVEGETEVFANPAQALLHAPCDRREYHIDSLLPSRLTQLGRVVFVNPEPIPEEPDEEEPGDDGQGHGEGHGEGETESTAPPTQSDGQGHGEGHGEGETESAAPPTPSTRWGRAQAHGDAPDTVSVPTPAFVSTDGAPDGDAAPVGDGGGGSVAGSVPKAAPVGDGDGGSAAGSGSVPKAAPVGRDGDGGSAAGSGSVPKAAPPPPPVGDGDGGSAAGPVPKAAPFGDGDGGSASGSVPKAAPGGSASVSSAPPASDPASAPARPARGSDPRLQAIVGRHKGHETNTWLTTEVSRSHRFGGAHFGPYARCSGHELSVVKGSLLGLQTSLNDTQFLIDAKYCLVRFGASSHAGFDSLAFGKSRLGPEQEAMLEIGTEGSAMMAEDLALQMQRVTVLSETISCHRSHKSLLAEKGQKMQEHIAQLSLNLADRDKQVLELRQAVAKMQSETDQLKAKLRWHENVRDCVSAAIRNELQHDCAVPLLPDWLILEGHHIDSESE
eukprot:s418_g36.t1